MPVGDGFEAVTVRFRSITNAAAGSKTTGLAGLDSVASEQTRATHRAAAVNANAVGARGFSCQEAQGAAGP
jgi:hypothetical protein